MKFQAIYNKYLQIYIHTAWCAKMQWFYIGQQHEICRNLVSYPTYNLCMIYAKFIIIIISMCTGHLTFYCIQHLCYKSSKHFFMFFHRQFFYKA